MVVGSYDNNVFVIKCRQTGESLLIDAANEHELLLELCQRLERAPRARDPRSFRSHRRRAADPRGRLRGRRDGARRADAQGRRLRRVHRRCRGDRGRPAAPARDPQPRPHAGFDLVRGRRHAAAVHRRHAVPGRSGRDQIPAAATSRRSSARSRRSCSPSPTTRSCCPATAPTRRSAPSGRTSRSGSTGVGERLRYSSPNARLRSRALASASSRRDAAWRSARNATTQICTATITSTLPMTRLGMRLRYGSSNSQYSVHRTSSAEPEHERHQPDPEEEPERVVEREAAHDRRARPPQVLPHALRQPRRSRVRVDLDRHARHRQPLGLGLHERLHRVAVPTEHLQPQRGGAAHRPEAAGRVAHGRAREAPHNPRAEPLQTLLQARELGDLLDRPLPHHEVGAVFEHRSDQIGDAGRHVLVVGVGVDDDVGARRSARRRARS